MPRNTISGTRGQKLPDLQAHGLAKQMKPAAKLIAEQDRLRKRARELGTERQALEEKIKKLESEHTRQWGQAIRSGEEAPPEKAIDAAKRRLEDVRREARALAHAGDLADSELKQIVAENAAEWDQAVQAKGEEILSEAQRMADALSAKLGETEGLVALHGWLTSGGQFYTPPTPAAISIDNVLRERRRELGLVAVGVIG